MYRCEGDKHYLQNLVEKNLSDPLLLIIEFITIRVTSLSIYIIFTNLICLVQHDPPVAPQYDGDTDHSCDAILLDLH